MSNRDRLVQIQEEIDTLGSNAMTTPQTEDSPLNQVQKFDFVQALITHNIQVTPVLRRGKPTVWQAGFRQLASDGWGNYVGNNDFTMEYDPEQAVKDLLQGVRHTLDQLESLKKSP